MFRSNVTLTNGCISDTLWGPPVAFVTFACCSVVTTFCVGFPMFSPGPWIIAAEGKSQVCAEVGAGSEEDSSLRFGFTWVGVTMI